jgi:chromatin remodeling complex protein RSC6
LFKLRIGKQVEKDDDEDVEMAEDKEEENNDEEGEEDEEEEVEKKTSVPVKMLRQWYQLTISWPTTICRWNCLDELPCEQSICSISKTR